MRLVKLVPGGRKWALLHSSATPGLPASVKFCVRQCGHDVSGTVPAKDLTLCCRDNSRKGAQHSTQAQSKGEYKKGVRF